MKKYLILTVVTLWSLLTVQAQNNLGKTDDLGRISLTPVVPEQMDGMPDNARSALENKLQQIATNNGLGGFDFQGRFILTSKIVLNTKDICQGLHLCTPIPWTLLSTLPML
jgi:hypothetical protein